MWPCWSGPGVAGAGGRPPPGVQARDLGKQQPALRLSWPGSHPSGCPGHMGARRGSPEAGKTRLSAQECLGPCTSMGGSPSECAAHYVEAGSQVGWAVVTLTCVCTFYVLRHEVCAHQKI